MIKSKLSILCPDLYKLFTTWLKFVTNGKGIAKAYNKFFKEFSDYSKLIVADKISINGVRERCYTFDKKLYDTCLISKIIFQSQIGLSINKHSNTSKIY